MRRMLVESRSQWSLGGTAVDADDANGNWDAVMTETALSIAVYTGNQDAWNKALKRWRQRVQEAHALAMQSSAKWNGMEGLGP